MSQRVAALDNVEKFNTAPPVDKLAIRMWVKWNSPALTSLRSIRGKPVDWKIDSARDIAVIMPSTRAPGPFDHIIPITELARYAAIISHADGNDAAAVELWRDILIEAQVIRRYPSDLGFSIAGYTDSMACKDIIEHAPDLNMESATTRHYVSSLIRELLDEDDKTTARARALAMDRWREMEIWKILASGQPGTASSPNFYDCSLPLPAICRHAAAFVLAPEFHLKAARGIRIQSMQARATNASDYSGALWQLPKQLSPVHTSDYPTDCITNIEFFADPRAFIFRDFYQRLDRRAAAFALALHFYRHDHGALPATANLLVPAYLSELPKDPFDATGQPIRYAPSKFGRPILYSVGTNGIDDLARGNWALPAAPISNSSKSLDFVFELSPPPSVPK